ncbi:hypothetical protein [Streptomyces cyaneofuscatus]|uniref:hypothetical protein n=1 Tax=Streptomyces cyaneofuscatus TaxID=66883 RepID=UPI00379F4CED
MSLPLLFLDMDGPLNPYAAQPERHPGGVHWKTGPLVEYARGSPFAWVDDEQGDPNQAYVAAHHPGPGLLHHVDPRIGLREDDFRTLSDFARSLAAPPPAG